MKSNRALGLAAGVACIAALLLIWRQLAGPRVNFLPSAAAGQVLASEINRLRDQGRAKVLILARASPGDGVDASHEIARTLSAALTQPGAQAVAVKDLPRAALGTMDSGAVTAEQFMAALEAKPAINTVVILAGLPELSDNLIQKIRTNSLTVIAVCGYSANVKHWLEAGALARAVVPRPGDPPPATPKSAREWFDREYLLVSPDSLSRLPY